MPTIRLLTYNVKMLPPSADTDRAGDIAEAIKTSDPDVICLQEVIDEDARKVFIEELAKDYPHMVEKIGSDFGPFEDSGLFFASRLLKISHAHRKFAMPFPTPGGDFLAKKSVLGVELLPDAGDSQSRLAVFCTHLESVLAAARKGQLKKIEKFTTQSAATFSKPKQCSVLLAGDMNIAAGSKEYTSMLKRLGKPIDAWRKVHGEAPGNTFPAKDVSSDPSSGKRIDYWFSLPTADSGNIELRSADIKNVRVGGLPGEPLSDHLSVELTIDW